MAILSAMFLLATLVGESIEDDITATSAEVYSLEDRRVTLSCNYTVKAQNLQWYRQDPGSAPQFLLLITDTTTPTVVEATPPYPRLAVKLNDKRNRVDLEISSAAVTDSALYYCAVKPTSSGLYKLIFGTGTKLIVGSRDRNFPSYYKLRSNDSAGNISACLASDFSNFNDTKDPANKMLFNRTEATRMTGDRFYSEVALYPAGETDRCREESKPKCSEDFFEPDEKVNFLALTILGLRLLFLKTVVFNILMTLRLWVS